MDGAELTAVEIDAGVAMGRLTEEGLRGDVSIGEWVGRHR